MKKPNRKLIEIPKDYLVIMMEAGYVYLAMQRLGEAQELFEGVAELAPKSEVPVMALGNVFAAKQDYARALKEFRKAQGIDPSNALTHVHIGEMLLFMKKKKAALKEIQIGLDLDPQGKAGAFAAALLEAIDKGALPGDEDEGEQEEEVTDPFFIPGGRPRSEFDDEE